MNLTKEEINSITIGQVIINKFGVYEGDLRHYFKVVFQAKNLKNPYHNFRHMFHVTWLCHTAILFYLEQGLITMRQARNMLIAALFHDYNHTGKTGYDDIEIELALRGLRKHILEEDRPYLEEIESYIRGTEFPHKIPASDLTLCGQILRDADMSQALAPAWIQQTIFGLSQEWSTPPIAILRMQQPFLSKLDFSTDWAKDRYPREVINGKIEEANELLALLE